jgi:Flp pilus assembly protein CpaB
LHTTQVVVAARDIEGGTLIHQSDVIAHNSLIQWATAIKNPSEISGMRAMRDLVKGQPLSQEDVASPSQYARGDRVAVAITVDNADAQLVRQGDTVDLLATSEEATSTVAAGASVVSVGAGSGSGFLDNGSSHSIVLALTPTEARNVASARRSTFTVVLRNRL